MNCELTQRKQKRRSSAMREKDIQGHSRSS